MKVRRSPAVAMAAAVVVTLGLLVGSSVALAKAPPRSGSLYVTKECTQYTGAAGDFCTITSSNVPWLKVGMRVVYADAFTSTGLDTDVVVSDGHGNAAYGHVILDAAGNAGTVTLDGGTGELRTLHGGAAVAYLPGGPTGADYSWAGTYYFR
jgi:hypothetical protein